jgi:hypothetical protein
VDVLSLAPATFVVGHPRSGTSLLRALLDGHPELLVLPFETHLFDWARSGDPVAKLLDRTRLWPTLHRHRPAISRDEVEDVLKRAFSESGDPRTRLLALVEGWRELMGARDDTRWVEKTPRHLYETSTLLRWFPDEARILVMRRDPRDVIASALKQKPSRTIFQMALTGRLAHQVVTEHEQDPRVSVVTYEDLVRNPIRTMQTVCKFLDVPYDPVVVAPTVLGTEYSGNSRFDSSLQGVSEAAVGRFHEVLSGPRLELAEALLAPVLSAGGYTPALLNPGSRHRIAGAAITMIEQSGLWRSRALRAAFGGA